MSRHTDKVNEYLRNNDPHSVSAIECARKMNTTVTTQRRWLASENTSYVSLVNQDKRRRVLEALQENPRISSDELAERVGFSQGRSMCRAFKSWYMTNLSDYQRLLQQ